MIAESPAETMLAAVLHGKEDLRMERIPVPHAGDGELLLRVGAALTCGTDLKVYRRGYHAIMLRPPIVFGHEVAGTVVVTGPGITEFSVGDRVVPMNSAPCDTCFFCRHGQQNLCECLLFNNGAYAEYMRIPARIVEKNTLLVPAGVPLEYAALTEPLACVVQGLNETGAQVGDTLVVIGAGPIGLMFIHVAHLRGLRVIAVVKRDDQVRAARRFGACEVVQISEDPHGGTDTVKAVRTLTGNSRGADAVIEAVATPATWEAAVAMVRKGGVVNFFGGPPKGTVVSLDTNRLHYGDITLKASFHHTPAACAAAFTLVCSGKFKCAEFITRTAPLEEVPAVFARMMTRSTDNIADIKTAVLPNGYRPSAHGRSQ
ncbi:MAG: alcohol dehydrogenase catalytic domain-containing protein [Acidobacteriaceae bacterium]|jgi:L-iditol 2-dehydrogenase